MKRWLEYVAAEKTANTIANTVYQFRATGKPVPPAVLLGYRKAVEIRSARLDAIFNQIKV